MTATRGHQAKLLRRAAGLIVFLALGFCGACSSSTSTLPPPPQGRPLAAEVRAEIDTFLGLVRQRLLLMHDVARWKWQSGQPITDALREEAVIARGVKQAAELGIDGGSARRLLTAQMTAGKRVQEQDFAAWKRDGVPPGEIKDLAKDLRPKIDQVTSALIASYARLAPHLGDARVRHAVAKRVTELSLDEQFAAQTLSEALAPILPK